MSPVTKWTIVKTDLWYILYCKSTVVMSTLYQMPLEDGNECMVNDIRLANDDLADLCSCFRERGFHLFESFHVVAGFELVLKLGKSSHYCLRAWMSSAMRP